MGLNVATIKQVHVHLQPSWFVGWDRIVIFNKMLHNMNIFLLDWSTGMKICLT